MATFRINKTKDFTVMSNYHLRDRGLSLKAKGLLSIMLSLPDTWDYSMPGLCALCAEGVTAVKSAMGELKSRGYLQVEKSYDKAGRFEYEYNVYEAPQCIDGLSGNGNPSIENPPMDNPSLYINTKVLNTKGSNTKRNTKSTVYPPVVINNDIPQGDGAKANDPDKPTFETFWAAYPRHTNKAMARKAWEKLRLTSQEYASLLRAIEAQKQSPQWQRDDGQYIPHPSTWLNQRRWEDELPAAQQTTTCTGDNIPVFDEEDMSRYGGKPIPRDWRKPWTGDE